jgi:formyl-CoA transferase
MAKALPLQGIRVANFGWVWAGPVVGQTLSFLGAEVYKIESHARVDMNRMLPAFAGGVRHPDRSLTNHAGWAGNGSVSLNLKKPEGREIFERLARTADVLVENFRPGVMPRLGVSYEVLRQHNPRLIYCAISGFGQSGPDAEKPAYDQIIQGLSGVMAVNGDERLNPLRCGFPVCDTVGGLNAAFAIMAALYHREHTGEGQSIDVALLDSIMPLMGWVAANWLIGNQRPALLGNDNFTAAPSGTFATRDGYINIAANKQEQWEALAEELGVPELKTDPRFQERDTRKKNRRALTEIIEPLLQQKETEYWVEKLNAREIPSGAILSMEEALSQPQIRHRGTLQTVHAEGLGHLQLFNLTAQFEKTPAGIQSAPPRHSQHTREILESLGYSSEDVDRLKRDQVI